LKLNKRTPRPDDDERLTAVDLFAGCGGLSSGLVAAGFRVLAAIEKDADAAETYSANHPDVLLYRRDIRRVPAIRLAEKFKLEKGDLDLLAGCPPCQGFTRLTEGSKRKDPRNLLIREYLRYVRVLRPRVCMLENVPGLLTRGKRLFDELCAGIEKEGYIINYEVLQLADYGVPQLRKRLVMLAGLGQRIEIPPATHYNPALEDKINPRLRPWRTVRDAIRRFPRPPLRSRVLARKAQAKYPWHVARDVALEVRKRLRHAIKNGAGRASLPAALRLACHKRRPDGYFDVYGAIEWDSPSPTITSGCTNASKGRFGHPSWPRPITAREAAKLQSFPVTYRFKGTGVESVARQIGNALPKRFATVLARAVADSLRS